MLARYLNVARIASKYKLPPRQRLTVFRRFLRLQFMWRLLGRPFELQLLRGLSMLARKDFGSSVLAYYLGLYEPGSMRFLLDFLRPGDRFADIGANVGVYSLLAAGMCGADVDAFEPVGEAARACRENLRLNSLCES